LKDVENRKYVRNIFLKVPKKNNIAEVNLIVMIFYVQFSVC